MQFEPGGRVPDTVFGVLRVVASQKGPGSPPGITVDVFYPGFTLLESQDSHRILESLADETGRLTVKTFDKIRMVLGQQ